MKKQRSEIVRQSWVNRRASADSALKVGVQEAHDLKLPLVDRLREKHLKIMKLSKEFSRIFGADIHQFYTNAYLGFDVVGFDDWLKKNGKKYSDKYSMRSFVKHEYGAKAADLVESLI